MYTGHVERGEFAIPVTCFKKTHHYYLSLSEHIGLRCGHTSQLRKTEQPFILVAHLMQRGKLSTSAL